MSTDRELLELAAKAAGLDVKFEEDDLNNWYPLGRDEDGDVEKWWNPLECDGDALRLAVDLGLLIRTAGSIGSGWAGVVVGDGSCRLSEVKMTGDTYRDTRLAIVLAAAEIGKAMP